jgi:hypothetical protein
MRAHKIQRHLTNISHIELEKSKVIGFVVFLFTIGFTRMTILRNHRRRELFQYQINGSQTKSGQPIISHSKIDDR